MFSCASGIELYVPEATAAKIPEPSAHDCSLSATAISVPST